MFPFIHGGFLKPSSYCDCSVRYLNPCVTLGTSVVLLGFQSRWNFLLKSHHSCDHLYTPNHFVSYVQTIACYLFLHCNAWDKGIKRARRNFLSQLCSQNQCIRVLHSFRCYIYLVFLSRYSVSIQRIRKHLLKRVT